MTSTASSRASCVGVGKMSSMFEKRNSCVLVGRTVAGVTGVGCTFAVTHAMQLSGTVARGSVFFETVELVAVAAGESESFRAALVRQTVESGVLELTTSDGLEELGSEVALCTVGAECGTLLGRNLGPVTLVTGGVLVADLNVGAWALKAGGPGVGGGGIGR